jgi:hypothetical protein
MRCQSLARLLAAVAAVVLAVAPSIARADGSTPTSPAQACVLKGAPAGPKGVAIYDAPRGGHTLATFTGAYQPMQISELPARPDVGRAKVATSLGSGSLRIEGWMEASSVRVFTARPIPVVPGHVWVSEGQRIRPVQATATTIAAELVVLGMSGQTVSASGPCDAFSLDPGTAVSSETPGTARFYQSRGTPIELYDAPEGSVVFTLTPAADTPLVFFSTEARGGMVHVRGHGILTVDAWARAERLTAQRPGEMVDQLLPSSTTSVIPRLAIAGTTPRARATREVPVRAHWDAKEKPIGAIEVGAEVYVLETVMGFTKVLDKTLGLMPPDDGGFWVLAAEVPR